VRALTALDQFGETSQAELGNITDLDRADVARAIDELEAGRLVRRRPDPTDGRRKLVSITPLGTHRLVELARVLEEVQEAVLAPLSDRERVALRRLLAKLQP
jgi:MarR family transcriptional regulator, lower aerobic nicotinate degradation pathway regulator